jgi:tetratricopeptide (TPR) repeat protein
MTTNPIARNVLAGVIAVLGSALAFRVSSELAYQLQSLPLPWFAKDLLFAGGTHLGVGWLVGRLVSGRLGWWLLAPVGVVVTVFLGVSGFVSDPLPIPVAIGAAGLGSFVAMRLRTRGSRGEAFWKVREGSTLMGEQRFEQALAAFDAAVELDPDNGTALLGRAEALEALGREWEASEVRAQRNQPGISGLALFLTSVPPTIMGFMSTAFLSASASAYDNDDMYSYLFLAAVWFLGAGFTLIMLVVGLFILRLRIGKGMISGSAIGILALTVTCFANLNLI